ncbi:MAG: glycosyltransferase family 2 protein [Actinomycetota bacterium]|nr:glycosyltransferase family 2 protein [Actinomycetota bacterium]
MDNKSLIIIVTYNSRDFIENCLLSIVKQSYKGWFLVIVDNASGDDTAGIIREFRNTHSEINPGNFKFVKLKKNIGFAGAVNYAVFNFMAEKKKDMEKCFKYLVLLNPDIYLPGGSMKKMISFLDREDKKEAIPPGIGVAGGLILDYRRDTIQHMGGKVSDNFITSHISSGRSYSSFKRDLKHAGGRIGNFNLVNGVLEVDYATGAFFITEINLFKALGGFDSGYRPVYFEELDYCRRVKKTGRKIVINLNSVARHFEGASVKKFSRNFYKFYHKNRLRCALINMGLIDFFRVFLKAEVKWIKSRATRDQHGPLFYAYFLNFIFLPYNLIVKIKNHLILNRLELK